MRLFVTMKKKTKQKNNNNKKNKKKKKKKQQTNKKNKQKKTLHYTVLHPRDDEWRQENSYKHHKTMALCVTLFRRVICCGIKQFISVDYKSVLR